jgi:hypothetical protein
LLVIICGSSMVVSFSISSMFASKRLILIFMCFCV